jgi:diguanylate cyclase (GGDEF)-like protein
VESNLDLSDWAAGANERRSALLSGLAFLLTALVITPFANVPLTPSYQLFAMILAASVMSTTITALLLLFQARALQSMPTVVLAAGFFFASATMLPYAVIYPGMFPAFARALSASPATNGFLWFSWNTGLLASMVAFIWFRRADRNDPVMRRRARGTVIGLAVAYVVYTAVALWADGLPSTFQDNHWTTTYAVMVPVMVILALMVITDAIQRRKHATVLDLWLGIVAFAIVVDLYLTTIGATRFTVGWYASRVVMLLATIAVLGMLLRQAAKMYAALVLRAEVLEGEAHTDILTGLPNRRRFDEEFARAYGSAVRRASSLAVAIVDIDRFKLYNDAFGHQSGDDALHGIAQAIADSVDRSGDFAARYGGEEFVVILEDTAIEGAEAVAERIRNTVLATGIRAPSGGLLSVSVGVAARATGEPADDLLRHADEALYIAKNDGRNRVAVWRPPSDVAVSG